MCQCRERGQAIATAVRAAAKGDVKVVSQQAAFVKQTMIEDGAALVRDLRARIRLR